MRNFVQWRESVVSHPEFLRTYQLLNGIWIRKGLEDMSAENVFSNIAHAERAEVQYTTLSQETAEFIERFSMLAKQAPLEGKVVLDVGCGDGRFVPFFLDNGAAGVVASDISIANLRRLQEKLKQEGRAEQVLLVADSCETLKLPEKVDHIYAILSFNMLGSRYIEALDNARGLLDPLGVLILAEPSWESALLFYLITREFDLFEYTARSHNKVTGPDYDRSKSYRVFMEKELVDLLRAKGWQIDRTTFISAFPSLLFGGLLSKKEYSDVGKDKYARLLKEMSQNCLDSKRVYIVSCKMN